MIKSLILYGQFFTRIPIPVSVDKPSLRMRTGVKYFSLFGLLIGCLEALLFWMATQLIGFNMAWVLVLFFDVVLTGGFHLDALADMADGLFSSRKKERMLEIMKDSRVGSNGVLVLIFYYAILIVSFFDMSGHISLKTAIFIVLSFNIIGKMGISLLFFNLAYSGSNPNGLGTVFVGVKTKDIILSQLIGLSMLLLMFGGRLLFVYGFFVLFIWLYRMMVYKKIDGMNGDTLGAGSPLSQMIMMLVLSVVI
ncbi:TPA: adenosylcobinamide-GDP ribazoletransferase [Enterococcus faecalis]|uniref:adenosylcobinamide-GDP ribazoletransferase n=1 Tax=Enterococcus faecalis TaxID=1351 RepID=UPI0011420B5D|nr:adenosylcobinamide-GDP ribazoletransferase [Enterococcus faecalis]EHV0153383.1 adenosylcobinamide-GDP ribazoletransferase [Enterococcus faecalis]NSV46796.1 adenosylcobinamide-GDP ribazoletransferase [Enterococcus faecalis]TQA42057.1 adenosylcobinamide-GDP ribazoletransferase [Enterococcus faecalis]HDT8169890.1 adenosylcobinamide-GDP ribazoletransferase [Enterococcus faecalis]